MKNRTNRSIVSPLTDESKKSYAYAVFSHRPYYALREMVFVSVYKDFPPFNA